jgi:hypothetical protein
MFQTKELLVRHDLYYTKIQLRRYVQQLTVVFREVEILLYFYISLIYGKS